MQSMTLVRPAQPANQLRGWIDVLRARPLVLGAGFGVLYLGALLLGLALRDARGVGIAWPASGLLVATLLLTRHRTWPWVLAVALTMHGVLGELPGPGVGLGYALFFGLVNCFEGVLGASLVRRLLPRPISLRSLRQVLLLTILTAGAGTAVAAAIGAAGIVVGQPEARFGSVWLVWWWANALGTLVVATVILTWASATPEGTRRASAPEYAVLWATLLVVTEIVFGPRLAFDPMLELPYLLFPILLWAALRFTPRTVAGCNLLLSSVAVFHSVGGSGPFAIDRTASESAIPALQVFLTIASLSALIVSAVVTEREQAEAVRQQTAAALRQSEERFAKAFRASPDAITITTFEGGKFLEVNDGFVRITGYRPEEAVGKKSREMGLWDDPQNREEMVEALRTKSHIRDIERRFRTKLGDLRICQMSVETFALGNERFIVSVTRDITEQKAAAEALEQSSQQLRDLTARLHAVREEERTAISREIHDALGQALTALKLDLAWLRNKLPDDRHDLAERVGSMLELTTDTLATVRQIATRLRPPVLDDLGLDAAIEWQADDFTRRAGITCSLDLDCDSPDGEALAHAPVRDTAIFQEALTNVARHAQASHVDISLRRMDDRLTLTVSDDGVGIRLDRIAGDRSLGLLGMRERAGALGGLLEIAPGRERGTKLTLHMPIESRNASQPDRSTPEPANRVVGSPQTAQRKEERA